MRRRERAGVRVRKKEAEKQALPFLVVEGAERTSRNSVCREG